MKISLAQFKPKLKDKQANVQKIAAYMKEAKTAGADVIVFPELAMTGYLLKEDVNKFAEEENGPNIQTLRAICKELSLALVLSFPERENEFYFISVLYIDEYGVILGKYRKTHLFHTETDYFSRGTEYPVFSTKFGKVGMMICYDLEFPEVARILRTSGAEILFITTANMKPYEEAQSIFLKSRAIENEIPIAICNRLGREEELEFFGSSMIVDHTGRVMADAKGNEGIISAAIDLKPKKDPRLNYIGNVNKQIYSKLTDLHQTSARS
ncbi:carbon-nitrogen hydrolase family protein [Bacillus sp. CFBP9009]